MFKKLPRFSESGPASPASIRLVHPHYNPAPIRAHIKRYDSWYKLVHAVNEDGVRTVLTYKRKDLIHAER